MKFLLDESAEYRIAAFLRELGHDVTAIAHDYPASLTDHAVLVIAADEGRIVITNDLDFGDLVFRGERPHRGVILFRLPSGNTAEKIKALGDALLSHADQFDNFVVIDDHGVRVSVPKGTTQ